MNKEQIREKMTDHWIPLEVIDELQWYINNFPDETTAFDHFTDRVHWGAASAWFGAGLVHKEDMFELLLEAYDDVLSIITRREQINELLHFAYERWFMGQYRHLTSDEEDDTLVE